MLKSLDVRLDNGDGRVLYPIASDTLPFYARLKHRFEVDGKSQLEWNSPFKSIMPEQTQAEKNAGRPIGIPSVIRAVTPTQDDYCPMSCAWQWFSYNLILQHIKEQKPEYPNADQLAKNVFRYMYRADSFQSNKRGTVSKEPKHIRHDCVNGTNADKDVIGLQPVFTGGNIVKVLGNKVLHGGQYYYPVACFDGNKPPPMDFDLHTLGMVMWGTIETRVVTETGGRIILSFDDGVRGVPYFVLVRDAEVCYISEDRIKPLSIMEAAENNPYL
mgnify:CR=1 FL=1